MSTALRVRPELTQTHPSWQWEAVGRQPGSTQVLRTGPDLSLRVADMLPAGTGEQSSLRSLLTARLLPDGTAQVTTRCAPPAILVTGGGLRLLPEDGRSTALAVLSPGDLLLLRSASVLDAEPCELVDLLKAGPDAARHLDVGELVRTMLAGAFDGAAAVARYTG